MPNLIQSVLLESESDRVELSSLYAFSITDRQRRDFMKLHASFVRRLINDCELTVDECETGFVNETKASMLEEPDGENGDD